MLRLSMSLLLLLPLSLMAQNFTLLAEHPVFNPYVNPAANELYQQRDVQGISISLAHRHQQLSSTPSDRNNTYLIAGNMNTDSDNKFSLSPRLLCLNTDTPLGNYTALQLGSGVHYKTHHWKLSIGIQGGAGNWNLRDPRLRPYDLGDPIIEAESTGSHSWYFGSGLSFQYTLGGKKNNVQLSKHILYLGAALPYLNICGSKDCYGFQAPGTTFVINRNYKWTENYYNIQLGYQFQSKVIDIDNKPSYSFQFQAYGHKAPELSITLGGFLEGRLDWKNLNFSVALGLNNRSTLIQLGVAYKVDFGVIRSNFAILGPYQPVFDPNPISLMMIGQAVIDP